MFERANARPGRRKLFTDGRQAPIDRNARAKVMFMAEESRRRGNITRAAIDVLRALLYRFANLKDGRVIPSYATLAAGAGCCERTVGRCIADLEEVGLVGWVHRIRRVRELVGGVLVRRVVRTSNSYSFPPIAETPAFRTEGHFGRGSSDRNSTSAFASKKEALGELDPEFEARLKAYGHAPLSAG
jgi:hypothetical protein